jgi:6-phosphogluconolactonase/glucosamine-6-phosphate isomerase/deaminase
MVFLVSGKNKRDMVKHILSGADLPAARARTSAPVLWMLDRAAAPDSYPLTSEPVFHRKT